MKIFIWFIFSFCIPTLFSDLFAASPIKFPDKRVGSLLELEEAVPATDVQRIIMGYLSSWENQTQVTKKHQKGISGLVYSSQGNYIASASEDGRVKLWYEQRTRWQARKTLQSHQEQATALALSRDGETVALAGTDGFIKIIALKDNKCKVKQVIRAHKDLISSLAFSPDSTSIISGSFDKTIKIWRYQNQNKKYQLTQTLAAEGMVSAVIFFAQGKNIISGCHDGTLKIWQHNQENNQFEYKQNLPDNARVTNPLSILLVADGTMGIFNAMNKLLGDFLNERKRENVAKITSSFDETILAISSGCHIELWSYQDTLWVCTQKISQIAIRAAPIAFSSDNSYFATGEGDNIKIYKLNQYKQYECIQTISDLKNNDVTAILFSPDNISLIYGLSDGSIKIIKNQALELYARAKAEKSPK